jgi:hypothetical protein
VCGVEVSESLSGRVAVTSECHSLLPARALLTPFVYNRVAPSHFHPCRYEINDEKPAALFAVTGRCQPLEP